jgi:hypothetical protein
VFDLLAAHAQQQKAAIHMPEALEGFLGRIKESMVSTLGSDTFIHGHHTQALFESLMVSLGGMKLLKREDAGEIFSDEDELKIPDYRIVLPDRRHLLVEVKNHYQSDPFDDPVILSERYVRSIRRYAELMNAPLRFAIFWVRWNAWTLVTPDAFNLTGRGHELTFTPAMMNNDMSILGDKAVGTVPPLEMRVTTDPAQPRTVEPDGNVHFTIGGIKLFSGDTEITDKIEQNIALYLMLYGKWVMEGEAEAKIAKGEFEYAEATVRPAEPADQGQGFEIIGSLSGMYSAFYRQSTVSEEGRIGQVRLEAVPGQLGRPGLGGFHVALRSLGHECVFVSEAFAPQVSAVVGFLLGRGWGIGSGGARGADAYALGAVVAAGQAACTRSMVFLPGAVPAQDRALQAFAERGGRVVPGSGGGRLALLARSRRLAREAAGVVAFLWGPSRGSVYTVREAVRSSKPAAVILAGGGAVLPVFSGGRWVPCRLGPVEAFRWELGPRASEPPRRSWLAQVFQVPEGEPTHAQLTHISSLSQGERLWYERGVLAGDTVVVPHEALSDTPAFLDTRRLMRRFRCTVREAAGLAELFLALDAGPAAVSHYEDEARRIGVARIVEDLVHLVVGVALVEQAPESDALDYGQWLGDAIESVDDAGRVAQALMQTDDGSGP